MYVPLRDRVLLEAEDCASTSYFGPSSKTLQTFQSRLQTFTKQAAPWSGARTSQTLSFHSDDMRMALEPFLLEYKQSILHFLATNPVFKDKHMIGLTLPQQRQLTYDQLKAFAECGLFRFKDVIDDPLRWISAMESLYYHGCNLGTKAGVHFGLFGATLLALGDPSLSSQYIDGIQSLHVGGCFALTELGHGSNAREIETTAHYDEVSQCFILKTPTETAQKIWIGNLAEHATHAVIFAQLYVKGEHKGVHVFLAPIRTEKGLVDCVRVLDCGPKMGLNGVDNGRLWLDDLKIPRENLLNKFASVNAKGEYESPIPQDLKRFTAMIGALVGGRIIVSQGALQMAKVGLTVAVKYALKRRQFGPLDKPEVFLIDYLSHQRRLFPLLAKTFALQFALNELKKVYSENAKSAPKELHILASGLKPYCTWHKVKSLQESREACGGMGFHASNRIGVLKTDSDIDVTWEGDNHVLLQQVSAALLKEFRTQYKSAKGFSGMMEFFGRQVSMELQERNIFRKYFSGTQLDDFKFYQNAFEYREARLLRALVNRLSKLRSRGPFMAWNDSMDIVKELAIAFTEGQILLYFIEAIPDAPQSVQPMLHVVCSLFALSTIQEHMDWYMTFGYFSSAKSKSIWTEINRLCRDMRPFAENLVDSFGIPDGLLDASILEDLEHSWKYPNVPGENSAL